MAQVVAIFNHKGGVGKTTTTINLAWMLAKSGKRVLVVDADPQCTATGFLLDPGLALLDQPPPDDYDPLEEFYQRLPFNNIRTALSVDVTPTSPRPNGYRPSDSCVSVAEVRANLVPSGLSIPPARSVAVPPSLLLLPGHMALGEWDSIFTTACENPTPVLESERVVCAIYRLLTELSAELQLDYILIDLSPSSSTMNKLFVLSSQFVLLPCSPDYFSYMALSSLGDMLASWDQWLQAKGAIIRGLPSHKPIVLGFTVQIFPLSTKGDGNPSEGFRRWSERLKESFIDRVIPKLQPLGMALPRAWYSERHDGNLAAIHNFQSAGTAANAAHVPVFEVTGPIARHTISGSTWSLNSIMPSVAEVIATLADTISTAFVNLPDCDKRKVQRQQACLTLLQRHNLTPATAEREPPEVTARRIRDVATQVRHLLPIRPPTFQ